MSRHVLVIGLNNEDDTFSIINKVNNKRAFKVSNINQLRERIIKAGNYLGWDGSKERCPIKAKCIEFHSLMELKPVCSKCSSRWQKALQEIKCKIEEVLGSSREEAEVYDNKPLN